ncbi:hypothetical protein [Hydrogenophaga sp. RWCD_12]|uniref:hypothetical protein n=1 Tax=Hydrogenophaga sp. RWCD_12 TaxID=3391190 RepID=UPI0039849E94
MTDFRIPIAAALLGVSLCAAALEQRERPVHTMVVVPVTASPADSGDGRPPAPRLREALRQPKSEGEGLGKPYRLSPEERQRLREQLRDQTTTEASREK